MFDCVVLAATQHYNVLGELNVVALTTYVSTVLPTTLPHPWWSILFHKIALCTNKDATKNMYLFFQLDILSKSSNFIQINLNNIYASFKTLSRTVKGATTLKTLQALAWQYTVPKKLLTGCNDDDGDSDDDDDDDGGDGGDGGNSRGQRRRSIVQNLAWISVAIRSFVYHHRRTSAVSTPTTPTTPTTSTTPTTAPNNNDLLCLIASLTRRSEILHRCDHKRSDADSIQVTNLYTTLIQKLKKEYTTLPTPLKKKYIHTIQTKWAEMMIRRTRILQERKLWSKALACSQKVEKVGGGKSIPFPLWAESKNISKECEQHIQHNKKIVRTIVRKTKARLTAEKEDKRKELARKLAAMKKEMKTKMLGLDKALKVRMFLKEKRNRQKLIKEERMKALKTQKDSIVQRRKEANRIKAMAFAKETALRATAKRMSLDKQNARREKEMNQTTQQIMVEVEKESARIAKKVIEMRRDMEMKLQHEEEERTTLRLQAREENKRQRIEKNQLRKEEKRLKKIKEQNEWINEDLANKEQALMDEQEQERRRLEEEQFEQELTAMKLKERQLNPVCLFCGFKKEQEDQLCPRCHGNKEEEEEKEQNTPAATETRPVVVEQTYSLWDYEEEDEAEDEAEDDTDETGKETNNDIEMALGMELPDEWCCPLTLECFHDPVRLLEDDQVYEKAAIEMWFQRGNRTSPMTNEEVGSNGPTFVREHDLKELIDSTLQEIVEERKREEEKMFHDVWESLNDDDDDNNDEEDDAATSGTMAMGIHLVEQVNDEDRKEFRLAEQTNRPVSSSSSSDDEEQEGETKTTTARHNKNISILVRNSDDATMAMYTNALSTHTRTPNNNGNENNLGAHASLLHAINHSSFLWVVLSVQAGRFAGGVFQRGVLIDHKTFSRYTTRKKQGGSQAKADSGGGGKASSAGATLRRYNESALHEEIQHLLTEDWSEYLDDAEQIFISCGHSSSKLLYNAPGGNKKYKKKKQGALAKGNPKVHKISFQTNRPTLEEVKRICRCCATCWVVPPVAQEEDSVVAVNAPTIRRGIEKGHILPMETKKRKNMVQKVLQEGYGEIMVWEVPNTKGDGGDVLTRSGWRNSMLDVEEDEGFSFLY